MSSQSAIEKRVVIIKVVYITRTIVLGNSEDTHADSCLSNGAILKWINRFKDGRETTENNEHTGHSDCYK